MRSFVLLLLAVCSISLTGAAIFQDGPIPEKPAQDQQQAMTKPLMKAKLVGAQRVLEGLVTENFAQIHGGAEDMKKISSALKLPAIDDKVYEHFGDEFRSQCEKLMQLSEEKNLEGAKFTYLSMTSTCINCHNHVRAKYRVERNKPRGPVQLIPSQWDGDTFRPDRSATKIEIHR